MTSESIFLIDKRAVLWLVKELSFAGYIEREVFINAIKLLPAFEEHIDKMTKENTQNDD